MIFTELESIAKIQSVKCANAFDGIEMADQYINAIMQHNNLVHRRNTNLVEAKREISRPSVMIPTL